jgi:hypothetical protein
MVLRWRCGGRLPFSACLVRAPDGTTAGLHSPGTRSDVADRRERIEIYVVADSERAGKALLTLMVDDLDRHLAELTERGIAVGAIETQPGRYRKAEIVDPEGNKISFGQALSPGND